VYVGPSKSPHVLVMINNYVLTSSNQNTVCLSIYLVYCTCCRYAKLRHNTQYVPWYHTAFKI